MPPEPSPRPRPTRRQVLFGGVALLAGGGLLVGVLEPHLIELNRHVLRFANLPAAFEGYRVALLADLHYPRGMSADRIRHACDLAMQAQPDLIALLGDLVHGKIDHLPVPSFAGLYDALSAPDGVFAIYGNHDHWWDAVAVARNLAAETPVRLLVDEAVVVRRGEDALAVIGIEDHWQAPNLAKAFAEVPAGAWRLALQHNPDLAEEIASEYRVDLQVSGHTHGGEVRIPFFGAPILPSRYGRKFEKGLVQGRRHPVFVSRGLCSPRGIRFNCRPEVVILELTQA